MDAALFWDNDCFAVDTIDFGLQMMIMIAVADKMTVPLIFKRSC